eukprot:COSAG06_NODE_3605_length_5130_cov_14.426953_4_plen_61_part_00
MRTTHRRERLFVFVQWQDLSPPTRYYIIWLLNVFAAPVALLLAVLLYYLRSRDVKASRNW